MISVDPRDLRALERDLWLLSTRAGPYATVNTLNSMAFQAQQGSRQIIKNEFINRNVWSARSVQVERAKVGVIGRSYSIVGSVADYMATTEFGGHKNKRGKTGVPIPTREASGEGRGAGPRRRLPRPKNALAALTLGKRGKRTANQRQRNAIAITTALRTGQQIAYLHTARARGLFRVTGTRKNAHITMLYDLTNPTVPTPKHPWLWPAVRFASMKGPGLYAIELEKQIKRQQLFKSKR